MKHRRQVCLITGMHRSGTSALSALVTCFDISLGKSLMSPKEENPRGFWENERITNFNDGLLSKMGCRWDLPSLDEIDTHLDYLLNSSLQEAKAILHTEFGDNKQIVIKDPRLSSLLPFWYEVFKQLDYEVKVIFLYRHPQEVHLSLQKRNGYTEKHSDILWLETLKSQLAFLQGECLFLDNEQLGSNQTATCKLISDHLGLRLPESELDSISTHYINRYYEEGLRHFHASKHDKSDNVAVQIYQNLISHGPKIFSHKNIKELNQTFLKYYPDSTSERAKLEIYLIAISSEGGKKNIKATEHPLSDDVNRLLSKSLENAQYHSQYSRELDKAIDKLVKYADHRAEKVLKMTDQSQAEIKSQKSLIEELLRQQEKNIRINETNLHKLLDDLEKARKETLKYQSFYDRYKIEKEAKEWLEVKLSEETFKTVFLEKSLKTETEKLTNLNQKITETQNKFGFSLDKLDDLFRLINSSTRWQVGTKIVSALNKLRFSSASFQQFDVANQFLHENRQWLKNQSYEPHQDVIDSLENEDNLETRKLKHTSSSLTKLDQFLQSTDTISFEICDQPETNVVVILYNKAELTLQCLQSIKRHVANNIHLIIIDNASTDKTKSLLNKVHGATIIQNKDNVGFLLACNQALPLLKAPSTLFLNNDTELLDDCISTARKTLFADNTTGAVGGRIILLDGTLQEAGSIVWNDGSCLGYGRGQDPNEFPFSFMREVDYVSGAFLMTRTQLFKDNGGFDTRYVPAYYEETDYCLSLKAKGYRTVYDPDVLIRHFEFGSAETSDHSIKLMEKNRTIFTNKHAKILSKHFKPKTENILEARNVKNKAKSKRILYIDDRVPHQYYGSGFPRSNFIVNTICEQGHSVTLFPLNFPHEETPETLYSDIDNRIEIAFGVGRKEFTSFWQERKSFYDIVWVSRPHNMDFIWPLIKAEKDNFKCVYDAEAIFADRQQSQDLLDNTTSNYQSLLNYELLTASNADAIVAVSERDTNIIKKYLPESIKVFTCGHAVKQQAPSTSLDQRKNLLFVGNLDRNGSPNVDSLLWFYENVWSLIQAYDNTIKLNVVGSNLAYDLSKINDKNILFHGRVNDITKFYNHSRVFVAPTRFAAGLPYKVHEAAAFGIPCIVTNLLAEQLGWRHDNELKVANTNDHFVFANHCITLLNDDDAWTKIHNKLISTVYNELNDDAIKATLNKIIQ